MIVSLVETQEPFGPGIIGLYGGIYRFFCINRDGSRASVRPINGAYNITVRYEQRFRPVPGKVPGCPLLELQEVGYVKCGLVVINHKLYILSTLGDVFSIDTGKVEFVRETMPNPRFIRMLKS